MKALYLLSTLFLGFISYQAYAHYEEGGRECVRPYQQGATDLACQQAAHNGAVAERFLSAVTR